MNNCDVLFSPREGQTSAAFRGNGVGQERSDDAFDCDFVLSAAYLCTRNFFVLLIHRHQAIECELANIEISITLF